VAREPPRIERFEDGVLRRRPSSAPRLITGCLRPSSFSIQGRTLSTSGQELSADTADEDEIHEPPTRGQLKEVFIASAIPFVAFGFFDNAIMILAGDLIDSTLCVTFCFSTMFAAAIGNTVSDVFGIVSGGVVEQLANNAGIKEPRLSNEQRDMRITKIWLNAGQTVGIVTGCLLGMAPLWLIDSDESNHLKQKRQLDELVDVGLPAIKKLLRAEEVFLLTVDEEKRELSNKYKSATTSAGDIRFSFDKGFVGHVAQTGHFVNIADVRSEPMYVPEIHDNFFGTGMRVESLLCMPICQGEKVTAVIVALNKDPDHTGGHFTSKDEDTLSFIASHISVRMGSIFNIESSFEEVLHSCEQAMNKRASVEWNSTSRERRMALYVPALNGVAQLIDAQSVALMLVDEMAEELYTEAIAGDIPKHKTRVGQGIAGAAVKRGEILSVDRRDPHWKHFFNDDRHTNYLGSGVDIRSELCVPLFDSSRKCLGVIQCINKQGGGSFNAEDVKDVTRFSNNLAIMLEEDGGLMRVLNLTRQRMQQKAARSAVDTASTSGRHTVLCFLERALNLPDNADPDGVGCDPYITLRIVRGNPLKTNQTGWVVESCALQDRAKDKVEPVRRFGKSTCVPQCLNPHWDETIPVEIPPDLQDVPEDELFVHLLLWDRDSLKDDDLLAQAAFNVAKVARSKALTAKPCRLQPIPGFDQYNLDNSMIWLSFSKAQGQGKAKGKSTESSPKASPPLPERINGIDGVWDDEVKQPDVPN